MANVAHNTLTGTDLHESKGVAAAAANTVYIADGIGSGTWSPGSTLIGITGQIADFATPEPPVGWIECSGAAISRATFANLFTAVTIQQTGSRTNASPIITGLTSTNSMRVGYYIGGTGITNGTTILSVDSPTQVTMSANAGSTGSGTIIISPWFLGDGSTTFNIPSLNATGVYRRSRSSTFAMGITQADSTKLTAHTHPIGFTSTGGGTGSGVTTAGTGATVAGTGATAAGTGTCSGGGTTDPGNLDHTHTFSGTTGGVTVQHTHPSTVISGITAVSGAGSCQGAAASITGADSPDHAHPFSGTTSGINQNHTHTFAFSGGISVNPIAVSTNPASVNVNPMAVSVSSLSVSVSGSGTSGAASTTGDAETRPITVVFMTCIKT